MRNVSKLYPRRPIVISASGSLDLEDIHGVWRPTWFKK